MASTWWTAAGNVWAPILIPPLRPMTGRIHASLSFGVACAVHDTQHRQLREVHIPCHNGHCGDRSENQAPAFLSEAVGQDALLRLGGFKLQLQATIHLTLL